ncbi:DUF5050 domain-containing protein [Imhoffiella purpurea]|uniref:Prolow-density lipoprotein receptor-related protein 1-like beta-propeller domain-containing protein n=1 Tax=Imhoffiella purpurea TaxID=1249627 RepID=W9V853_9GAMM|nr:DUF5050 domain-containing protein [Imhoffiella purpurea]EXJ15609.1 hypothetical protein D779_1351 [Imhoffiella purpurea]
MTAFLLGVGVYLSLVGVEMVLPFGVGQAESAIVTDAAEIHRPDAAPAVRILLLALYLVPGLASIGIAAVRLRRLEGAGALWTTFLIGTLSGIAAYGVDPTPWPNESSAERFASDEAPGAPAFSFANLKEGGNFAAAADWVYFAPFRAGQLCRAHPDGSAPSVLLDHPVSRINVVGDRLLFLRFVPGQGDLLFELALEGGRPRLLLGDPLAEVWVQGDWVYYRPEGRDGKIHRMRLDGSGRERIGDDSAASMALAGSWIYYINETQDRRLYRMRLDGSDRERLGEAGVEEFLIAGDRLFFRDRRDHRLYRMDRIGSDPTSFLDVDARSLNTDGIWLYYSDFSEDARLYRIALDGGLPEPLTRTSARFPHVVGGWLYFGVGGILDMDIFRLPLTRGMDPTGPAQPWLVGFPGLDYRSQ